MKSLLATWGLETFTSAANTAVRREIDATFTAGRSISVMDGGKFVQLSQAEYLRRRPQAETPKRKGRLGAK
jgi:hypothetical protein